MVQAGAGGIPKCPRPAGTPGRTLPSQGTWGLVQPSEDWELILLRVPSPTCPGESRRPCWAAPPAHGQGHSHCGSVLGAPSFPEPQSSHPEQEASLDMCLVDKAGAKNMGCPGSQPASCVGQSSIRWLEFGAGALWPWADGCPSLFRGQPPGSPRRSVVSPPALGAPGRGSACSGCSGLLLRPHPAQAACAAEAPAKLVGASRQPCGNKGMGAAAWPGLQGRAGPRPKPAEHSGQRPLLTSATEEAASSLLPGTLGRAFLWLLMKRQQV